jgi:hypothetical protein
MEWRRYPSTQMFQGSHNATWSLLEGGRHLAAPYDKGPLAKLEVLRATTAKERFNAKPVMYLPRAFKGP